MSLQIKVPEKVTGVRLVEEIPERITVGYDSKRKFHRNAKRWHVWDDALFKATKKLFYQCHLDPVRGQLIVGLDEIAEDYVQHQSLRSPALGSDWGTGNLLGGLYILTKEDIESRLGENNVTIGEVTHPFRNEGSLLLYQVSKNGFLKAGDAVVCVRHSGDSFFDYQLLHEEAGDLVVVKGMDFGSYTLSGNPTKIFRVECTLYK